MINIFSTFPFTVSFFLIILSTGGESRETRSDVTTRSWNWTISFPTAPKYYSYNLESSHKSSHTTIRQSSGEQEIFSTLHNKIKMEIRRNSSDLELTRSKKKFGIFAPQFLLHRSTEEVNQTNHQSGSLSYNVQRHNHEIFEESIANSSSSDKTAQPSSKFNRVSILQNISSIIDSNSRKGIVQSSTLRKFNNESGETILHSLVTKNNTDKILVTPLEMKMTESKTQGEDGLDSVVLERNTGPIEQGLGSILEPKIKKLNPDTRKSSTTLTHSGSKKFWFDFDEKRWKSQ